ncbi:MAG: FkbM family methyltransferase [Ignavibacteriae bacterium]|nr:FkbM family methyltransferase [Ignavibacteriota bacterium]
MDAQYAREIVRAGTAMRRWIEPATVSIAVDLGSRDGCAALALARLFPNARVFAFECNPAAIPICRAAVEGNERVSLVECAVSDRDGDVDFYAIDPVATRTPHADGNIGASSLFLANPEYPNERYVQRRITVPAVTLRSWAARENLSRVDVLWMDLQGAELLALHGLGDMLASVSVIYTEVAHRAMYIGQPLFPELDAFLDRNGFVRRESLYADEWLGMELYVRASLRERPWWKRWRD